MGGNLELDGWSNYLECPDAADFDVGDSLTVSMWFKARKFEKVGKGSQVLIAKGETWQLQRRASDGTLEFSLLGPTSPPNRAGESRPAHLSSKRNLDDTQWHHIVGTYDGKRTVLYVDGTEEGAVSVSGPVAITTAPLVLGDSSVTHGRWFGGWLDDVRLYSRGLSEEEVRSLCAAGKKP
jgi:hypothetical protein